MLSSPTIKRRPPPPTTPPEGPPAQAASAEQGGATTPNMLSSSHRHRPLSSAAPRTCDTAGTHRSRTGGIRRSVWPPPPPPPLPPPPPSLSSPLLRRLASTNPRGHSSRSSPRASSQTHPSHHRHHFHLGLQNFLLHPKYHFPHLYRIHPHHIFYSHWYH